jgi:hypothetical protein
MFEIFMSYPDLVKDLRDDKADPHTCFNFKVNSWADVVSFVVRTYFLLCCTDFFKCEDSTKFTKSSGSYYQRWLNAINFNLLTSIRKWHEELGDSIKWTPTHMGSTEQFASLTWKQKYFFLENVVLGVSNILFLN